MVPGGQALGSCRSRRVGCGPAAFGAGPLHRVVRLAPRHRPMLQQSATRIRYLGKLRFPLAGAGRGPPPGSPDHRGSAVAEVPSVDIVGRYTTGSAGTDGARRVDVEPPPFVAGARSVQGPVGRWITPYRPPAAPSHGDQEQEDPPGNDVVAVLGGHRRPGLADGGESVRPVLAHPCRRPKDAGFVYPLAAEVRRWARIRSAAA